VALINSIRGAAGGLRRRTHQTAEFYVDGIGFLEIVVAGFTFIYLIVGYNFLREFFYPSIAMLNFMVFGYYMAKVNGYFTIKLSDYDLHSFLAGITSFSTIFILNYLTVTFFNYDFLSGIIGSQGVVVTLSPFWVIMFYASVGVAEELLFTLFFFVTLLKGMSDLPYPANLILAAMVKSIMFAAYHQFAAIQIFGMSIFKNTVYSFVLYAGSFVFCLIFYWTKRFSAPATGHALLNAVIQLINLQVIRV